MDTVKRQKPPTSGRQKGTPNKFSADLRNMILTALNDQEGGGVGYLTRQAVENPVAFMGLLGKVLPTTLTGPNDSALLPTIHVVFGDDGQRPIGS